MLELLWLIPALPLAGFTLLASAGRRLPPRLTALVGAGATGLAALVALLAAGAFLLSPPPTGAFSQNLWTWMQVGDFSPQISLYLDRLSLVMMLVVTWVGFPILLYSTEFMRGKEGYARFFAVMNLFVGAMLILVLAGDLLFLYLGWEGVGLCSYLLIGFWFREPANGRAARKAFIVTRVGDTGFTVGLFLLFNHLSTLSIQDMLRQAAVQWPVGSGLATAAAGLLLAGALGKSAQLPLQVWLPDAMAGPTPVSALIHAATMVTAGVYLIARTQVLFLLAPVILQLVAVLGAATLLLGACSSLAQRDIKRALAYSTMSQVGYMFLALGVGAWSAAIFHFMTHAFFKALLFLAAGAVIQALDHEHDLFRMGGLRHRLPLVFWTFLIGASSLAALPAVTAGFFSKDLIIAAARISPSGSAWLWGAGLAGAFLTALYSFRLVCLVFLGEPGPPVHRQPGPAMRLPLLLLAIPALGAGWIDLPGFLRPALAGAFVTGKSFGLTALAAWISVAGILLAFLLFAPRPAPADRVTATGPGRLLHRFWLAGWGFDRIYDLLLLNPFVRLARAARRDVLDLPFQLLAGLTGLAARLLTLAQSGRLRWYAMGLGVGAVLMLSLVVFR